MSSGGGLRGQVGPRVQGIGERERRRKRVGHRMSSDLDQCDLSISPS